MPMSATPSTTAHLTTVSARNFSVGGCGMSLELLALSRPPFWDAGQPVCSTSLRRRSEGPCPGGRRHRLAKWASGWRARAGAPVVVPLRMDRLCYSELPGAPRRSLYYQSLSAHDLIGLCNARIGVVGAWWFTDLAGAAERWAPEPCVVMDDAEGIVTLTVDGRVWVGGWDHGAVKLRFGLTSPRSRS